MKGLIVTALLCLQGCAGWTQQDTALFTSALAAALVGTAVYSVQANAAREARMLKLQQDHQNGMLLYQLQRIEQEQAYQHWQQQWIQGPTVRPIPVR